MREDFGTGPLPELSTDRSTGAVRLAGSGAMTTSPAPVRRRRDADRVERRTAFVPGQPDMWAFVLFEALVFTALLHRLRHPPDARAPISFCSRRRTWTCASGSSTRSSCWPAPGPWRAASRRPASGRSEPRSTNAFLTMLFGFVFLVSKVLEWASEDRAGVQLHHRRVLLLLLLPDGDPLPAPADRLRRPRRRRLPALEPRAALPGARRDVRHLLAHDRLPLGPHLRVALRHEVIRERRIREETARRLAGPVRDHARASSGSVRSTVRTHSGRTPRSRRARS